MKVRSAFLIGLVLLPQLVSSQLLTCPPQSTPVTDTTQRSSSHGFSILPPSSGNWCSLASGPTVHTFITNKFLGTNVVGRPDREEITHSFVILGAAISIKEEDLGRFPTLKEFVEAWTERSGLNTNLFGPKIYADLSPSPKVSHISSSVIVDESVDADCVRYEGELEERDNPTVPRGWVLSLLGEGTICRHPDAEDLLIEIAFTERRRRGWTEPDTGLRQRLREQAEATLNSLRFEALEPLQIAPALQVSRGRPLGAGETVTGSLNRSHPQTPDGSYYESWYFEAEAGQRLRVSLESDDFDALLVIGQSVGGVFGARAGSDDGGRGRNARLDFTIPEDGEYIVIATSYSRGEVGAYTLEIEQR